MVNQIKQQVKQQAPQESPRAMRELYRKWVCKVLEQSYSTPWKLLKEARELEQENGLDKDGVVEKMLRTRAIELNLYLPPEMTNSELFAIIDLEEFSQKAEQFRGRYAALLRLDPNSTWKEVDKGFEKHGEQFYKAQKIDWSQSDEGIRRQDKKEAEKFQVAIKEVNSRFQFAGTTLSDIVQNLNLAKYLRLIEYFKQRKSR